VIPRDIDTSADDKWSRSYADVAAESPCGRLMRQYWHPVMLSTELPTRSIRRLLLLGERFVIFRLETKEIGVLAEQCPHRLASLVQGFLEPDGIRCCYHGWKFSPRGKLLDAPFGAPIGRSLSEGATTAGEATECGGIIFVRLDASDQGAPLPHWDILTEGDWEIVVQRHEVDCNWLQYQENAADLTHTLFLHGAWLRRIGIPDASGFYSELNWYGFQFMRFGLVKAWKYENRAVGWGNLAIFPNILRIEQEMHWRVPLSSERTLIFQVSTRPLLPRASGVKNDGVSDSPLPAREGEPIPLQPARQGADLPPYSPWSFQGQDAFACASQGRIVDRRLEHTAPSDLGLLTYRKRWQDLCDEQATPSSVYDELINELGHLDPRPWMGVGDIAVSRPLDRRPFGKRLAWREIFTPETRVISVPRGTASKGPLG